jgi:hypothetical protein
MYHFRKKIEYPQRIQILEISPKNQKENEYIIKVQKLAKISSTNCKEIAAKNTSENGRKKYVSLVFSTTK